MKSFVIIDEKTRQLRGNIHMHTTRSDGKITPDVACEKYRSAGYDFIMLSDHEIYFNSDKYDREDFLVLGGTESALKMNEDYRWIVDYHKKDGNERVQHKHMHLCCIKDYTAPEGSIYYGNDEPVPRMLDRGIDSWNRQVEIMKEHNNLVVINHPHWSRLDPAHMLAMRGCVAFEVWNSGDVVHCGGMSDEAIWNYCLNNGRRILAVAADDSHKYTTDFAAGWTMVCTDDFSKKGICQGFKDGRFYASCGPTMKDMRIEDGVLRMKFTPCREVRIDGYDCDGTNIGPVSDDALMTSAEWKINEKLRWFRIELIDEKGRKAWMQPVFMEDII